MAPAKSSSSINRKTKKVNKRTGTRSTPRNQPAPNKQNEWKRSNGRLDRLEKKIAAEDLKTTPLATFISRNLNSKFGEMGLIVREIFSKKFSYFETKEGKDAKKLFEKHSIATKDYQYRYRMLAVFQKQDGEDVLFFTMSVKEYAAHNWCTIDYLDSVPFFQNENIKKTPVYDEVLYSYFEYSRMIGFERIHIFVCAIEGDKEYFFHQRPSTMKFPDQDALMSWYKRLLNDEKKRIIGCVNTQRPTDGRRPRNRTVADFIFEISYSEFYRLAMEEQLESDEVRIQNFERVIENYPEEYENRLLFVNYRTQEVENSKIRVWSRVHSHRHVSLLYVREVREKRSKKRNETENAMRNEKFKKPRATIKFTIKRASELGETETKRKTEDFEVIINLLLAKCAKIVKN